MNNNKQGWGLEKQVKHNYNETKINQFAQHQELLRQRTVPDVLRHWCQQNIARRRCLQILSYILI